MENNLSTKQIGDAGENVAVKFLESHGYIILETNWRYGQAEVDIIAKDKTDLVFAEVKTRASNKYGEPEMAVTKVKQRQYQRLAEGYIQKYKLNMDVRFDIIAITNKIPEPEIYHIKDAFYPYN
jgi:putative endonuclease